MQLVWIILAVAAFFAYRKIEAGLMLNFSFGFPYQIETINGQLTFLQPVTILNGTATNINLQAVDLNFETVDGYYLGRALLPVSYYLIPGYKSVTISVRVISNISDLIRAIPDLGRSVGYLSLSVRYVGTVRAEYITIPVNEVFTIDKSLFGLT